MNSWRSFEGNSEILCKLCFISLLEPPSAKDVLSNSPEPPLLPVIASVCGFGLVVVVSIISLLWYYKQPRFVCNTKGLTKIAVNAVAPTGKASFLYSYVKTRLRGQYNGKWPFSLVYMLKPLITATRAIILSGRSQTKKVVLIFMKIHATSIKHNLCSIFYLWNSV